MWPKTGGEGVGSAMVVVSPVESPLLQRKKSVDDDIDKIRKTTITGKMIFVFM